MNFRLSEPEPAQISPVNRGFTVKTFVFFAQKKSPLPFFSQIFKHLFMNLRKYFFCFKIDVKKWKLSFLYIYNLIFWHNFSHFYIFNPSSLSPYLLNLLFHLLLYIIIFTNYKIIYCSPKMNIYDINLNVKFISLKHFSRNWLQNYSKHSARFPAVHVKYKPAV